MPTETRRFELQVRDTNTHHSNTAAGDSGATVVTDELHPNEFTQYDELHVYIEDDHDVGFDVELAHTHADDDDFSAESVAATITLAAGADDASTVIDGPVGMFRFTTLSGGLASAPTTGSLTVVIHAYGGA